MEKIKSLNWQTIVIALLVISNLYLIGKVNEAINTADEAYYKADSINDDFSSKARDLEIQIEELEYRLIRKIEEVDLEVDDLEDRISSVEFDLLWK